VPPRRRRLSLAATLVASLTLAAAAPLGAQVFKIPPKVAEPAVWLEASVGYFGMQDLADSHSNSIWRFSSTLQYRAALGYSLGRGSSLGLTVTYASVPLDYASLDGTPILALPIPSSGTPQTTTKAHADVGSLMATFHAGGGEGFHAVLDAGAGVTRFSSFRSDNGSHDLEPTSDLDPAFVIASGIGYSTSARTEFTLVQEYGSVFHQRGGLPSDVRTTAQQLTTRLGVRVGLGARRPR
jgi:hypothetical protein